MAEPSLIVAQDNAPGRTLPVHALRPCDVQAFLDVTDNTTGQFLREQNFEGQAQKVVLLPGQDGIAGAVLGIGTEQSPASFGALATKLPSRFSWTLQPGNYDPETASLGIALGAYQFNRFKAARSETAMVMVSHAPTRARIVADAICLSRNLINTPANYLGPSDLADAGADIAARYNSTIRRISGAALEEGYPALFAVGAGSERAPVMLHFTWGGHDTSRPLIALCGKGVCFDTGGYDLKPSSAMLRMKKDMGGAAITLGIAQAVMALNLPVRLDVRIGCVENSVSGRSMRPQDVLRTRSGLNVEVGNTDAEGRLVLADILSDAADAKPDWLLDFATLTGAARVALGPDLPALFANDDGLASALLEAGIKAHDPLWRLPLWDGYDQWLESPTADLNSVASKPFAGAIVAALFLRRFVPAAVKWAHLDIYAWNDHSRPARPEGGEAQALQAVLGAIEQLVSQ